MKTYTVVITGSLYGVNMTFVFEKCKGYDKDSALRALYRSCAINPFIEDRIISILEVKS